MNYPTRRKPETLTSEHFFTSHETIKKGRRKRTTAVSTRFGISVGLTFKLNKTRFGYIKRWFLAFSWPLLQVDKYLIAYTQKKTTKKNKNKKKRNTTKKTKKQGFGNHRAGLQEIIGQGSAQGLGRSAQNQKTQGLSAFQWKNQNTTKKPKKNKKKPKKNKTPPKKTKNKVLETIGL